MITATIKTFGNYSLLAVIDQFTSLVKAYLIVDGEGSQTFYSYSKADKAFVELIRKDNNYGN